MSGSMDWNALRGLGRTALLVPFALSLGVAAATAQQEQVVPKSPAYAPPQESSKEESSWIKICTKEDKADAKQVCLVRYEGLEPKTGRVLISAAVRSIEGEPKQTLLVNVPLSYSLVMPTGAQIKIDEGEPIQMQYSVCIPASCQIEMDVSKEVLGQLRKGSKMYVAAMNTQGKTMAFPIPLNGFSKTSDGPPVDNVAYQMARQQMLEAAHQRQKELAKDAAATQPSP